jgi:biopolymer transport protein ExbB
MDLISRGGFMMIPLLLLALAALTVIFERAFVWTARLRTRPGLVGQVMEALEAGNIADSASGGLGAGAGAAALASARARIARPAAPVEDVLAAGLARADRSLEIVEKTMQARAEAWVPVLEKRLEILDTVITAAPLMGLLGTITGMMASFRSLAEPGAGGRGAVEAQAVTGGVAEALIATATGLIIALICLFAYNYFRHRARVAVFEMESAGARLLDLLRGRGAGR